MSLNPYDPPSEPLSPAATVRPFPTLAATIHLTLIGVLALGMAWKIAKAPDHLIGVALLCGLFFSLPYICSFLGAMAAIMVRNHSYADQFRRFLELFLTGMILFDLMFIGIILFAANS
ncbi:hypothetical protein FYK55_19340 [Roseiconus nitratireducens]|uniref:Uncharacterized protein n=1 Tax=Roseiconus nitratireducens TaxID=2605748 RepID=A0A5M6D442_9BACT|nr:hypothetical protein [Roseiconus nitratireducens]KAA5541052.1 hypothetical protein FYK55_19340 [Roseiconus nitratireducens]